MLGTIILIIILGIEIGWMSFCLKTKSFQKKQKHIVRGIAFLLFSLFLIMKVFEWSFRWKFLFYILLIQAVLAVVYFVRKKPDITEFKKSKVIKSFISRCFLFFFAIAPAIIFPQFKPLEPTGNYAIKTDSYTLTDNSRKEAYSKEDVGRSVSIQFWYPDTQASDEKYPLVVFSHGAFGYRGSNFSVFQELASNGYVVVSIDHTYHSFFTKETSGRTVIGNLDFINEAMMVENGEYDEQETYNRTREWLKLRLGDMNFVLDTILAENENIISKEIIKHIDAERIGLFGHSLGGATAAQTGRDRDDIDAAIVLDGTMLGEELSMTNGQHVLNQEAYPIPLLNLYNEQHYEDAIKAGVDYPNILATENAISAHSVVIRGSGHINFTDLPMFSPFFAKMLGVGEVDSTYCIETMNNIVLNYFNYYLKDSNQWNIQSEY